MTYLILGSGTAGIAAAEKLREIDTGSEIIIAAKEDQPYHKMYLPDFLSGSMKRDKLISRSFSQLKKNKIELLTGSEATAVDPDVKKVSFGNAGDISYDKLLVATGTRTFIPSSLFLQDIGIMTVDSLKNASLMSEKIIPLDRAAVVGAGLTGIQTAVSLSKAGLNVVLLEKEQQLLGRLLNKEQSDALIKLMASSGVKVIISAVMTDINKGNIVLDHDGPVRFDHLVSACGTVAETGILPGCGLDASGFISVNEMYETSFASVYAAGSVIKGSGEIMCSDLAGEQGTAAAMCMAGLKPEAVTKAVCPVIMRELEFSFWGDFLPDDKYETIRIKQKNVYKKLVLDNGHIKGFIFIGDSRKAKTAVTYVGENRKVTETDLREILA
jgi:nitrite reductase (NADH) large subunit